jgi:MinD-like ATPase involved in chromosome partitioning or flagellar assembly
MNLTSPSDVPVLVAAAGAGWETAALDLLARPGTGGALHKRCVDLSDLVASASTGLARVALVSGGLRGLDADAMSVLAQAGVGVVVVLEDTPGGDAGGEERGRMQRIGARRVLSPDLAGLADAVRSAAARPSGDEEPVVPVDPTPDPTRGGRSVVVWGPAGAPGRTTVATGLAAELAHRGRATLLLDADPYGGAVAQHLGVLDGASGLLAASRAANAGELDATRLAGLARAVGGELRVLTGLPRPDRWPEVRPATFDDVLTAARAVADWLVVDVGFSLEGDQGDPFATGPRRNHMTLAALTQADEVVVVGAADPVGLSRLARGLVDLHDLVPAASVTVVVNRTRPSLGWSEREIHAMVEGFLRARGVHFVPDDRAAADRALMAGRSLVESGDSALRRGISAVADGLVGGAPRSSSRRLRRRTRTAR